MRIPRLIGIGIILVTLLVTQLFAGGYILKQKQHTDPMKMMGFTQPAKDEIVTTWLTSDKIRSDQGKQSVYLFLDQKKMILVNHENKSWSEMPLNLEQTLNTAMEKAKGSEEEKQKFSEMTRGLMKMKITVTPTGETRKIGQWNCKKYIQTLETAMGPNQSIIWASEDIKLDYEVYSKLMAAVFSSQPGMGQMMSDMLKELKKIKGVPVLTETTVKMMNMEMKSTQELLEVKEADIPDDVFTVPAGYKKKDVFTQ